MKTYKFLFASGLALVLAGCETSRQTTDGSANAMSRNSNTGISTTSTSAGSNSGTTMNSTSPVTASAADPMNNTPAAVSSNQTMMANSNASTATPASNAPSVNSTSTTNSSTTNNSATNNSAGNTPASANSLQMNAYPTATTTRRGSGITAPPTLQSSFGTQFPNASNVQWYQYNAADVPIDWELTGWPTLTEKDYAVVYNVGTEAYHAWYDANGTWIGSTSRVANNANLPAPVMKLISDKYAGYTISEVHAETYKNQSGYEIEMAKGTDKIKIVVDAQGNILKQKTKTVDANGNVTKDKIKN